MQSVAPVVFVYLPAGHVVHDDEPASDENVPPRQVKHCIDAAGAYFPDGHETQLPARLPPQFR